MSTTSTTSTTTATASTVDDSKIDMVRNRWDEYADVFTTTANKRVTIQCARELHSHMELDSAQSVLEVAAGGGLGSLDIVARMTSTTDASTHSRQLLVTDLAPRMVELAAATLQNASTAHLNVRVAEANGQDLANVAAGTVDRVIANMCLQLTPDPDAMLRESKRVLTADGLVGFTIWGRPEHSGNFTIDAAVNKELGLTDGAENPNFALGKDLEALRQRFATAGFSHVRIWPHLCVLSLWSGADYAAFQDDKVTPPPVADDAAASDDLRARRLALWQQRGDEWLATKGTPIGLEAYIVIAKA